MKDSDRRCYLARWGGKRGAERNPVNYERRDDGSHICENEEEYYEWWYLDASFDNGYHAVVTFHYRNMFLNPIVPSVQIFIYKPDGTKIAKFELIDHSQAKADPDRCHVIMGDNWIIDHGDCYEMHMLINGVGAHLTLHNKTPSWKPGAGFNYRDEKEGRTAGWVVPVPHAKVEGELYLDGVPMKVNGTGYHDHNWGNYYCWRIFKSWYWGRMHNDIFTLDYGWVLPREDDAPVIAPLLIARDSEIVLSTDTLMIDLEDLETEDVFDQVYSSKLILHAEALDVKLHMTIEVKRIIDREQLPKVTEWDQYYFRFLADYQMKIEIDGKKESHQGEMLQEMMLL